MADNRDRPTSHPTLSSGVTRRDFLERSSRMAVGLGALRMGVGRGALPEWFSLVSHRAASLPAHAAISADEFALGNDAIRAAWSTTDGAFRPVRMKDGLNNSPLPVLAQGFSLTFADRTTLQASDMRVTSPPHTEMLPGTTLDFSSVIGVTRSEPSFTKRGVTLDSFLFDDGWDDSKTLWHFNSDFPDGFTKVEVATHKYGAAPGVWMSPWGGYGKEQGFETNKDGFELSGPVYYKHFRDTCIDMIRRYGVNQFKFDGTGDSSSTFPGSPFDNDFDAAIHLIGELRAEKPDLYVNLTTGTYPSPFWLRYADSIWRGGDEHEFAGIGSGRQRWITYRDADTYEHVVRAGALFPINSLMLYGMIFAGQAHNLMTDPGNDFPSEAHSYFGTGTQLQEMYITPSLLSRANWDTIPECAKWSRSNADTLVDTHWVGGDPQRAASPWAQHRGKTPVRFRAGEERKIRLEPFEVLTLEMKAQ